MTDLMTFPLDDVDHGIATGPSALRFTLLDSYDALPAGPGLYVLLGARPGAQMRPLGFGYLETLSRLPASDDFAAALREGLQGIGLARLPDGQDGAALAARLGRRNGAPLNTRRAALEAIDAARLPQPQLPLAAE